ncbi:MAG: FAD-dependent oxidoreductase, partial [Candidatus Ratteibacteria bacterium]
KYKKDDICLKLRHHSGKPGYWWIEIGYPFDTIYDNEEIKHNLLAHVFGIWDHLKNEEDHGFSNFVLEWVSMVPGKRESRRFVGDYILNENDIKKRRKFEDAIAYGGWFIDLHTPGGILAKDQVPEPTHVFDRKKHIEELDKRFVYIYQIPFRCIYSKNIKNLLFAGRNISVTHVALGTTRLMGTCSIIGQAAGTSVYLCKKYGCSPREIYEKKYYKELQQILLREGCFIPDIKNEDEKDLCRNAKVSVSSEIPLKLENFNEEIKIDIPVGEKLPLKGKINKIKLKCRVEKDTILKFHLRNSYDLWDFNSDEDIFYKEIQVKKGDEEIIVELNKEFEKGIYWFYFEKNDDLFLKTSDDNFPGMALITKPGEKWLFRRWTKSKNLYFEIEPEIYPFEGENIISGVSRPEKWTNVWISDKRMPRYIEIDFGGEKEFNLIQFVFDSDLDKEYTQIPPFYIPENIPRDFNIYAERNGKWEKIFKTKGNSNCFYKCKFKKTKSKKIKIEFLNTAGISSVYVYEIRIYNVE